MTKITIPQHFNVIESRGGRSGMGFSGRRDGSNEVSKGQETVASRELYLLLNQIARKINAVDALDSGTATAADIVAAMQK